MSKRIFGIFLLLIAAILTFAIIGLLPDVFSAFFGLIALFSGNLDAFQTGEVFGRLIYWILHFVITFLLWRTGIRWTRNAVKEEQQIGK